MVIGSSAVSRLVEAARWHPALAGVGSHEDEGGPAGIPLADVDLLTDEQLQGRPPGNLVSSDGSNIAHAFTPGPPAGPRRGACPGGSARCGP